MHPGSPPSPRWIDALDQAVQRHAAEQPPWTWFDQRVRGHMAAHASIPSEPLDTQQGMDVLHEQCAQPTSRRRVIYLHVPFCKHICSFCAFFRKASTHADLEAYTQAALRHIEQFAATTWSQQGPPFEAVYFGGGTPTALSADQLVRLVAAVTHAYPLADDCEITVECRFDGLDRAYLRALQQAGVNRLSFGVQSFDTALRRSVGRITDSTQIMQCLSDAADLGFQQINVDLIYNLPGQSLESWAADMRTLQNCPATAASIYTLIPMRGSALVKQIEAGQASPLGDAQWQYKLFALAHDTLSHRPDWQGYSFHHFGDQTCERSVYNQTRAGAMDTLGIGCGAGGQIGSLAYMNPMNVQQYVDALHSDALPQVMAMRQPQAVATHAAAWALTESGSMTIETLLEALPAFESTLLKLLALGLVIRDRSTLRLSRDGCFWGYNIAAMISETIAEQCDSSPPASELQTQTIINHDTQGASTCSS